MRVSKDLRGCTVTMNILTEKDVSGAAVGCASSTGSRPATRRELLLRPFLLPSFTPREMSNAPSSDCLHRIFMSKIKGGIRFLNSNYVMISRLDVLGAIWT